jgi:D-arabinose 1-dehydrogenase-like Zn-dependent alcohol dehydrogenase
VVPLIVCTAPNPKAISPLTDGLDAGGRVLVLAPCGPIEVNSVDLIMKAAGVVGFPSGHALDSEEAIVLTKLQGIRCMVKKFPLKDAQKAMTTSERRCEIQECAGYGVENFNYFE